MLAVHTCSFCGLPKRSASMDRWKTFFIGPTFLIEKGSANTTTRIRLYTPAMNRNLDRREFVKLAGAAGVVAAATWESGFAAQQAPAPGPDAGEKDLVMLALDA